MSIKIPMIMQKLQEGIELDTEEKFIISMKKDYIRRNQPVEVSENLLTVQVRSGLTSIYGDTLRYYLKKRGVNPQYLSHSFKKSKNYIYSKFTKRAAMPIDLYRNLNNFLNCNLKTALTKQQQAELEGGVINSYNNSTIAVDLDKLYRLCQDSGVTFKYLSVYMGKNKSYFAMKKSKGRILHMQPSCVQKIKNLLKCKGDKL
jgi:hypothetical protein